MLDPHLEMGNGGLHSHLQAARGGGEREVPRITEPTWGEREIEIEMGESYVVAVSPSSSSLVVREAAWGIDTPPPYLLSLPSDAAPR